MSAIEVVIINGVWATTLFGVVRGICAEVRHASEVRHHASDNDFNRRHPR